MKHLIDLTWNGYEVGLYFITIVNDIYRVIRSDAPSCGITDDCHSDISTGVICAPRENA